MLQFVILFFVFTIISSEKPGQCPPSFDPPNCKYNFFKRITCKNDESCTGVSKCCRNECGGYFCLLPMQYMFPQMPRNKYH